MIKKQKKTNEKNEKNEQKKKMEKVREKMAGTPTSGCAHERNVKRSPKFRHKQKQNE